MADTENGVVIAGRGRRFVVRAVDRSRLLCDVRQKIKDSARIETPVAVGDDITYSRLSDARGIIESVQARRTAFFRPAIGRDNVKQVIAANLDRLAIVVSIQSPPLKTGLIDRFLIAAQIGDLSPLIVFNKIDLQKPDDFAAIVDAYGKIEVTLITVSAESGEGLDNLKQILKGGRTLFAGHSGVGKSSILNALVPGLKIPTLEVSRFSNRGKHATTHVELHELPSGGYVIDSPGLKVMGLWEVSRDELPLYFSEFKEYASQCQFNGCSHSHEPNCAVKDAVERGDISHFRHKNYLSISASLEQSNY